MKAVFRHTGVLVSVIVVAMGVTGCNAVVTVNPPLVTINAGDTASLQATSTSPLDKSFVWSTADAAVATVDQTGTVTGVNEGQTTVMAEGASSGAQGQAAITVSPPGALSAFVTVKPSLVTIDVGETASLQATSTSPQDTSFVWSTANAATATVDQTGVVTGVNEGQTTVTAKGVSSGAQGQAAITVSLPPGALSAFEISVDTSIVLTSASLPPFTVGAPPRRLAAIVDERGNQTEFVEDELMLVTDDENALDAFVTRWGGEVLATVDPAGSGLAMPKTHLVRIDTALGDPSRLESDVLALDPNSRGASRVSSDAGLRLISASAKEAVAGLDVGMNWVGRGSSLASGSTTEASTGPSGFSSAGSGYSSNAYNWNYLDSGSTQDIGVAQAWYLLANARKLSNKVKIAIIDMGFSVAGNMDVPPGLAAISNVPFNDPTETENLLSCSGGASCPWHGTEVLGSAMGMPDNSFGTAGPGGPVADPIVIFSLYDFFTSISAILEAAVEGAQIVNMSYGAGVPAALFFTVGPFDLATGLASQFMLLCAAAGNDNKNVDSEDCFFVCWEDTWWTPCENDGVFCVGGLSKNSQYRANFSNYGDENVDIFAPGTLIVGPDPSSGPGARAASGTSFSSPFVAGVAALVWAANPSLSASEVRDLLVNTGHSSPDNQILKYVDAYAAVSQALPPVIAIRIPQNGEMLHGGFSVSMEAFVHEGGKGTPTVQWTSSIEGNLGAGLSVTYQPGLSYGTHIITARATFPDSSTLQDSVTVTVVNDPPVVTITSPTDGSAHLQGQPVLLAATSTDINESSGHLSDAQMSWYVDDVFIGNNHTRTIAAGTLSVGTHVIRLVGSDGSLSDSKSVNITTNPNPVNLPPDQVNITNPIQGSFLEVLFDGGGFYIQPTLEGNAHDPEDGTLTGTALAWTWSVDGGPSVALGSGVSVVAPKTYIGSGQFTYDITLTATDSASNSTAATIQTMVFLIL